MTAAASSARRPLAGRSIVTTRASIGQLDRLLVALGADVVHVPLIEIVDVGDGGRALTDALAALHDGDWIAVTSPAGATRLAGRLPDRRLRFAVVGTATAAAVEAVTGRPPDVVPVRQTAADLAAALPAGDGSRRVVLATADRADPAHVAAISARGYVVERVVAYRTVLRTPTPSERRAALGADAVAFASGSAATAWHDAIGTATPPVVASIGPSTTAVAERLGLVVTVTARDHSIEGLAEVIVHRLTGGP